jgi:hypothetical protein
MRITATRCHALREQQRIPPRLHTHAIAVQRNDPRVPRDRRVAAEEAQILGALPRPRDEQHSRENREFHVLRFYVLVEFLGVPREFLGSSELVGCGPRNRGTRTAPPP